MSTSVDSKVKPRAWLVPEQVEKMRTTCYSIGHEYLQNRNEALIQFLYDTGLRVGECVSCDHEQLQNENAAIFLPAEKQKQFPNENTPDPVTIELASSTQRLVTHYLNSRRVISPALWCSHRGTRMTTEAVRYVIRGIAEAAEIRPYMIDGSRGQPKDVTPHTLRHSVAYRMMNEEEGNTLYDVRNRLRHKSIETTERIYDHYIRV